MRKVIFLVLALFLRESALGFQQHQRLSSAPRSRHPLALQQTTNGDASFRRDNDIDKMPQHKASGGRVNEDVRTIMRLLMDRFDSSPPDSSENWNKLRRFLYRATSNGGLTLSQVQKVLGFLGEDCCSFSTDLQRSILQSSPRILSRNVKTQLQPTADFLHSLYGDDLFQEAVRRNPDLLLTAGTGYRGDALDLMELYLQKELGVSRPKLDKLKRTAPGLFQTSMVQMLSVVGFLEELLEHRNVDPKRKQSHPEAATKTIRKLVESHPNIFQLSVSENLRPRIQYLRERCQLQEADLASLLKSNSASVLGLSVEDNLKPKLDLLSELLAGQNGSYYYYLRKIILSHPQILCLSMKNLRAKIAYFDSIDRHGRFASRVLIRSPAVYSLSLCDNIIPTVEYLARIWGTVVASGENSDGKSSLSTLLIEYPSILTLSLKKNIQPTINFYHRAGYLTLDEEGNLTESRDGERHVVRGRYIAASLHNRLLPRWHYCNNAISNDAGPSLNGRADAAAAASLVPLHVLAGTTDEGFCRHFGFNLDAYTEFKEEAIPRLKFSSQFDNWLSAGVPIDV